MSSPLNNANMPTIGEIAWPYDARVIGSEGFRRAFLAVASRRPVGARELDKPTKYVVEREKHWGISSVHLKKTRRPPLGPHFPSMANAPGGDVERSSSFFLGDFSLPDTLHTPFSLYLPRPEYMEVPRELITAIDPILADIDVNYIRDALADSGLGLSMHLTTQRYKIKESNAKEVCVILEDSASVRPTHMLAIYAPINARAPTPHLNMAVSMFPVHSLVLAANCAKLAPFPPQINQNGVASGEMELVLPVVPIFPENSRNIHILLEYLYRKRIDVVFGHLLRYQKPVKPPNPGEDEQLAQLVATRFKFNVPLLFDILGVVTDLWDNACYLGVYDDEFWNVLDVVRRLVLMTLAMLQGRPDTLEAIEAVADALGRERAEPTGPVVKVEEPELMMMG